MSRAFTREDGGGDAPIVPPRPTLPEGVPNYVTPRGLALLERELQDLQEERRALDVAGEDERRRALAGIAVRQAQLVERIRTAVLVQRGPQQADAVRFGSRLRVRAHDGAETVLEIVGVDEADAEHGRIAFVSPLARALLGKREGDKVSVVTPRGTDELDVIEIVASEG